jgi:hypothetical protein
VTASDTRAGTSIAPNAPRAEKRLRIDFLFLDLSTCNRCRGADRSLEQALETVGDLLAASAIEVQLNKIHVESAEQSRELRFATSPTIRVNGRDVALELRESACGSEACTDGCVEAIACRVWIHDGREYTEPPVPMIVDAIMREAYAGNVVEHEPEAGGYELPDNLERFFASTAAAQTTADAAAECCPPGERRTCCDPEHKVECCGASTGQACGCR